MERRPSHGGRQEPTAEVRRQVYERDQGRCAYVAPDGRRCGSTWQVEVHHVGAAALGGSATLANLELRCRGHNRLEAERVFGRAHMDEFRRKPPTGEKTSPSGSSRSLKGPDTRA
jgi:5-methylcytosine-specific restriction endonuclease McrA